MGGLIALSRGIDAFNTFIGRLISWAILLSVLVSAGNAVVRYFQTTPLFHALGLRASNAFLELQWYLYGAAFLLASAWTLKQNEHIRIDVIYGNLRRSTQHWIDLIGTLAFMLPFTGLMVYYYYPWFMRSYRSGEMSANAGGLIQWPAKLLLLIGFSLLFIQGISEVIKKIAVMTGRMDDPHGESRKDIALREAEEHAAMTLAALSHPDPSVMPPGDARSDDRDQEPRK
ncbi:MAG: TRAP transporter small permease subunit [Paracoccus sp. (in: a-proteobacteria)]|nr:TRAP transporter small permease subunit [Paracoccus sp. (in: a-proteobacteria)]